MLRWLSRVQLVLVQLDVHQAARTGNLARLKLVIKLAPERVNETDCLCNTPLHCAARNDQEAVVSLLLSAKADVDKTDIYGYTPLHFAAESGGEAVGSLLLSAKADVNATNSNGSTPLHLAAQCSREAAVSPLLPAKADVNKTDKQGDTPLGYAQSAQYAKGGRVGQLLVDAGGH